MKKLTRLLAVAASIFALAFTGCSSQVSDSTVSGDSYKNSTKQLTIYATSEDNVVTFPKKGNGRTITPAALDGTALKFTLKTKNLITGNTSEETEVSFVANTGSTTEGVVNISLDVANYELTLKAYDTNDKELLQAVAYADLRSNEAVKFFLMPINSGNGIVSLKLYTKGWKMEDEAAYMADAYITKSLTDDTEISANYKVNWDNSAADKRLPNGSAPGTANFPKTTGQQLAAGTYNFVVAFSEKGVTNGKKFYWSDRIVVLPNQTTEAEIAIPPVIGKKPAAPADLYVGYKTPVTDDSLYYLAEFNWTDKSNNEQYFQLELLDISSENIIDTVTATKTAITNVTAHGASAKTGWDTLNPSSGSSAILHTFDNTVYYTRDTDLADGISYYDAATNPGGLTKNNTHLGLNLPLGKRYLARMCSVNDAGTSDYTYAIINSATPYTSFKYGAVQWPADAVAINVFKITYNLVGGAFYDSTYTAEKTTVNRTKSGSNYINVTDKIENINTRKDKVIVYEVQSDTVATDVAIMNPLKVNYTDGAATKTAALFNGTNKWASWKLNSTTTSENFRATTDTTKVLDPYTYKYDGGASAVIENGFGNLDLYAAYSSASAKIYNPADYKVKDEDVLLYMSDNATYNSTARSFTNGDTIAITGTYTYTETTTAPADWATKYNTDYYTRSGAAGSYTYTLVKAAAPAFTATKYTKAGDVYTAVSTEPDDWATSYVDYLTTTFTVIAGIESWAADTYYAYDASAKTYTLTTSDPGDLSSNSSVYFTKAADTPVAGAVPTWAASTYYSRSAASPANKYIYVLVRNNKKYASIQLQLDTTTGTPVGTYKSAATQESVDTYNVLAAEPADWSTDYKTKYYTRTGTGTPADPYVYTLVTGGTAPAFTASTYYEKLTDKYDLFSIPTESVASTSYQATIKAYAGIKTDTPYTYPIIFTITE